MEKINIPINHKYPEIWDNFIDPMQEEVQQQDMTRKIKEALKESTDDQQEVLKKDKFSPVPFLLVFIFILGVIIFSLASKDTFIQDNFDLRNQIKEQNKMECEKIAGRNVAYHSGGINLYNRGIRTYGTIFICWEYQEQYVSGELISSPK